MRAVPGMEHRQDFTGPAQIVVQASRQLCESCQVTPHVGRSLTNLIDLPENRQEWLSLGVVRLERWL